MKRGRIRWWIAGLLFASTVINYIDRQTFSVLSPVLKAEYKWTNTDLASVLIAFRIAYTIGQSVSGRLLDRLGTRVGLACSVTFYTAVAALTSLASGLGSFRAFRFLLGAGESANWPGATKAVAEWFPARERGFAVALFDSGSSIGGAVAPFLVLGLYHGFGSWRPVFLVTALLGFVWIIAWLKLYHPPELHPAIGAEELAHVRAGQSRGTAGEPAVRWIQLLRYRQTWGLILGRLLLDPYWFLVAEWFAIYLLSRGFRLEDSMMGFWAPFLAADLGNFSGAALSSWFIRRGWPTGKARRTVMVLFGPSMLALAGAAFTSSYVILILLFAWASFAYAACSTMFLALPADVFHSSAVASVSGLSGTGAGIGVLISTYLIGVVSDRASFQPIVLAASVMPCVAVATMFVLLRPARGEKQNPLLCDY
ncbi:MAG TPA: MFS transporter [Bryobacteraceae bacterium]|nr:MFS transporter [Bryobacteraceae bacterium]